MEATADRIPNPYTETSRACYNCQHEVTQAWLAGKFPSHNRNLTEGAILYSSDNFKGIQHPDGSGTLRHYHTTEAIRTRNGLIINNAQCWSRGFAHCSPPSPNERDARLPLDTVAEILESGDEIHDIRRIVEDDRRNKIAVLDGYGVLIGGDASSIDYSQNQFAFRVDAEEIAFAEKTSVSTLIDAVLRPTPVHDSGIPVVHSGEYRKTKLDEDELEAHKRAGGKTSTIERSWRGSYEANRQFHRADLQGNVIVRQGEWFFIPRPKAAPFNLDGTKRGVGRLGNHIPSSCAATEDGRLFVKGMVRHRTNDHNAVNLGDTWHEAVTHDRNVRVVDTSANGGRGGWD